MGGGGLHPLNNDGYHTKQLVTCGLCLADFWPLIFTPAREEEGGGGGGGSYVHSAMTFIRAKPVSAGNMCILVT